MDSNLNVFESKVYFVEEVPLMNPQYTEISITPDVPITTTTPIQPTDYRVVGVFNSTNWKSGIWTNGVFNSGIWEGGIWYDGIFKGVSI